MSFPLSTSSLKVCLLRDADCLAFFLYFFLLKKKTHTEEKKTTPKTTKNNNKNPHQNKQKQQKSKPQQHPALSTYDEINRFGTSFPPPL